MMNGPVNHFGFCLWPDELSQYYNSESILLFADIFHRRRRRLTCLSISFEFSSTLRAAHCLSAHAQHPSEREFAKKRNINTGCGKLLRWLVHTDIMRDSHKFWRLHLFHECRKCDWMNENRNLVGCQSVTLWIHIRLVHELWLRSHMNSYRPNHDLFEKVGKVSERNIERAPAHWMREKTRNGVTIQTRSLVTPL